LLAEKWPRTTLEKRGQHRMRGQQTAGILNKDLRHRGIGKHFAEALFLLKEVMHFRIYGAVKVCFLRDE
jgi:hypothetical protein